MLRLTIITTMIVSASAIQPMAMDTKCDEASMGLIKTQINVMTDMSKKAMAMKELDMAEKSMKANSMDDCKMHIDNAMKSIGYRL